jgi:Tol biopolymer transport system component
VNRLAGGILVVAVLFALIADGATAEVPAGPRLTFVRANDRRLELISSDPTGGDQRVIFGGGTHSKVLPNPFLAPAWSGDGTRVVFNGLSRSNGKTLSGIYAVAADGSGLSRLPLGGRDFEPVLSPDGRTVAFTRQLQRVGHRPHRGTITVFEGTTTWLLDLESGAVRQLTRWKNGRSDYPTSFSPDGSTLLLTRDGGRRQQAVATSHSVLALGLDGSGMRLIAHNAIAAVYSPDGARLALLTTGKTRTVEKGGGKTRFNPTELAVANADGSGLTRLTHTKLLELQPSWDPSGQRIAYIQFGIGGGESESFGFGDSIMEINADGSCRTKILSDPGTILSGPTWQPGPGREAGPISC